MKKYISTSLAIMFAALVAGALSDVSAQTVSGSLGTVPKGGSATGRVTLAIPSDLHVNSNNPNSKYAIPTSVKVTSSEARLGAVRYPAGKTKKFAFSETPINVYEGQVTFTFSVSVPASFKGDTVNVKALVRYQACNDEVCFPPRTREVTLTAKVK
jgi:thiol:disulfide interchange protein DsbD